MRNEDVRVIIEGMNMQIYVHEYADIKMLDTRYGEVQGMSISKQDAHLPGTEVRGMKRANQPRSTKIEEGRIYSLEMVQNSDKTK